MIQLRTWRARLAAWSGPVHRWLRARELVTLVLLAVLAGGVWLFAAIAGEVSEGDVRALDERLLLALRDPANPADPLGPRWVQEVGRDLTALGGVAVLTLVTLVAAGFLWLSRRRRSLGFLVVAVGGGQLLSLALKRWYARPRPDLVPHGSFVYTASFPSGHAMMSAITYLTIAALLARVVPGRSMKLFVMAWALAFTGLAGASRVYLGVHWPTDVVAGWAVGASWAVAWWLIADTVERRRRGEVTPPR